MMKIPAFTEIGKESKELLYGGKIGVYQYDKKLAVTAKTTHGMTFALKSLEKDGVLAMETKATYTNGPVTVDVIANVPKVTVSLKQTVLDGLNVTVAGSLPDPTTTGKLTFDYVHPYFTSKAACSLNTAPVVDVSAAAGYNRIVVGADASIDVGKSELKKWTAALSYVGPEFTVAAFALDGGDVIKGTYHQVVDAKSSIGAEIVHNRLNKGPVSIMMGYQNVNVNGDFYKVKIGNDGMVQTLYEFKPRAQVTVAASLKLNAVDTAVPPKLGFAVDYQP